MPNCPISNHPKVVEILSMATESKSERHTSQLIEKIESPSFEFLGNTRTRSMARDFPISSSDDEEELEVTTDVADPLM